MHSIFLQLTAMLPILCLEKAEAAVSCRESLRLYYKWSLWVWCKRGKESQSLTEVTEGWNHKIIEGFGLERDLKEHLVPTSCQGQGTWTRVTTAQSSLTLSTSTD